MEKTLKLMIGLILLFPTAVLAPVSYAGTVDSFGTDKPVTLEDFRPKLMDDEWYNESWSYNVYLKDGSFIAVDFRISNMAMTSDHDGVFQARFVDPGEKKTKCEVDLDDDEWSYSKSGFSLNFGKGQVSGDLKVQQLKVRCKKLSMDLKFVNQTPPYKPGGGVLRFGKDEGIYSMVFTSPRAEVTGTVVRVGKTIRVSAPGRAMHARYNMRPDKQVHRWFRFSEIDEEVSVIMAEMEAVKDFAGARNGWALVLDSSGRLLATPRVRFEYDGFIQDSKSDEGYKIPRRVRVIAVDGNTQLTGVLLMKNIQKVVDFTDNLNAVSRVVVRRFTKPKDYYVDCSYQFRLKLAEGERQIKGDGVFRYFYVNP